MSLLLISLMILQHNKRIIHSLIQSVPKYFVSQLETHHLILRALKVSMKMPTSATQNAQVKLISQMIQNAKSDEKVNFLANYFISLRHQRWCSIQSLFKVGSWIRAQRKRFTLMNKIGLACLMVEQRRNEVFHELEDEFLQNVPGRSNKQKRLIELLYWYSKSIVNQKLESKVIGEENKLQAINPKWEKQINLLNKGIGKFNSAHSEIKKYNKIRSNLEIEVEALLHTLGYKYKRQVQYSGFTVDFQVLFPNQEKDHRKMILQVMGWPHYTCENKVFGRDILRCLILNKNHPLRIIHSQEINRVRGTQNRLQFIKNLIECQDQCENSINFQIEALGTSDKQLIEGGKVDQKEKQKFRNSQ